LELEAAKRRQNGGRVDGGVGSARVALPSATTFCLVIADTLMHETRLNMDERLIKDRRVHERFVDFCKAKGDT